MVVMCNILNEEKVAKKPSPLVAQAGLPPAHRNRYFMPGAIREESGRDAERTRSPLQKPGAIRAQPGIVRLTSGSLHERSLATKKRRPSRDQLRQTSTVHAKQPARLGKLVGPANAPSTVNRAFRSRI